MEENVPSWIQRGRSATLNYLTCESQTNWRARVTQLWHSPALYSSAAATTSTSSVGSRQQHWAGMGRRAWHCGSLSPATPTPLTSSRVALLLVPWGFQTRIAIVHHVRPKDPSEHTRRRQESFTCLPVAILGEEG